MSKKYMIINKKDINRMVSGLRFSTQRQRLAMARQNLLVPIRENPTRFRFDLLSKPSHFLVGHPFYLR